MMRKINKYGSVVLPTTTAAIFTDCNDQFLEDRKLYGSFNGTTIYENYESADNRIAYLYYIMLPSATGGFDLAGSMGDMSNIGISDQYSKCTEEYGGILGLMNPNPLLDYETVTDYFDLDDNYPFWVRIRECNDMTEGVIGSESLTERQKQLLLG